MRRGGCRAALPLLLLAAAALVAAEAPLPADERNAYLGTVPVHNADEAAVAAQLIRGFESVADEILTGKENPIVFSAAAPIDNPSAVNVSDVQAKVRQNWATQRAGWCACSTCMHPSACTQVWDCRARRLPACASLLCLALPSLRASISAAARPVHHFSVFCPSQMVPSSPCQELAGPNSKHIRGRSPPPQVFATAIATWQMGVWNAPSNRGLRASKFFFYDRYHYYQIPKRPIGTVRVASVGGCHIGGTVKVGAGARCSGKEACHAAQFELSRIPAVPAPAPQLVLFHGCYHDASGNWPYDPVHCPECLGLPEEVAHVKVGLPYVLQTAAGGGCSALSSQTSPTESEEAGGTAGGRHL